MPGKFTISGFMKAILLTLLIKQTAEDAEIAENRGDSLNQTLPPRTSVLSVYSVFKKFSQSRKFAETNPVSALLCALRALCG